MAGKVNTGFEDERSKSGGGGGLLAVDNSEVNSHTYVYEPDKSLRKMTIEALPSPENYQDLNNIAEYRPTLDELITGNLQKREVKEEEVDTRKGKVERDLFTRKHLFHGSRRQHYLHLACWCCSE